jgi:hypothetical protein
MGASFSLLLAAFLPMYAPAVQPAPRFATAVLADYADGGVDPHLRAVRAHARAAQRARVRAQAERAMGDLLRCLNCGVGLR